MTKLITPDIRVSQAELQEYRQLALKEGKSLSRLVREVMEQYAHQMRIMGAVEAARIDLGSKRSDEPIRELKPSSPGPQEDDGR